MGWVADASRLVLLRDKNCRDRATQVSSDAAVLKTWQRQTRDLRYPHRLCKLFRHPDWQMHARAIGLADGKSYFIVTAITPLNNDHFAAMDEIRNG